MTKIVIDARMVNFSGIGTVLQNLIPFLLRDFDLTLLGGKTELEEFNWNGKYNIIEMQAAIYSAAEQIELFRKIPFCDMFISPHYNIPLLPVKAKRRLVVIHDVNHLVFREHLSLTQKLYSKLVINSAVKLSDIVFTISEFSKSEILKYTSCSENKIEIMYCAVDKSKVFTSFSDDEIRKFVYDKNLPKQFYIYIGSERHHKNFCNLLKAVRILNSSGKKYNTVVVGREEIYRKSFSEMLDGVENIYFTGYLSNEELAMLFKATKFLVFPSYYEGFGLPPLEAMANGCPVISSNAASLPEVCGNAALYVNPFSENDIAEKVELLFNNEKLQEVLKRDGLENVKRYSWEDSYAKFKSVIIELIGAVN